jgi:predicted AlkP superfamily pyrophosphatase or phosphodiesterase
MRRVLAVVLCLAAAAPAAHAAPLQGPKGTSYLKVLVIGTDGTRWDLVRQAMDSGQAPNLRRLSEQGLGGPTLLPYAPPQALTLSEVGWSTISTGAGPAKHGVTGVFLNNDPRQATKNGYLDFLSRIESVRPSLSTFLASDWANIGQHEHGGPIFGDGIDARHTLAAEDTVDSYDKDDQDVTDTSARYLRDGSPDAGFVYLGVVDEAAHNVGSATPTYRTAIAATDRRIGQLVSAIRARPSYGRERWTVIVTTDHGQQNQDSPSQFSHGGGSDLERTSFVVAAGPGIPKGVVKPAPGVVDVAPTVLHQLGLGVDPAWRLDGSSFVGTKPPPPPPTVRATLRLASGRPSLTVAAQAYAGAPAVSSLRVSLTGVIAVFLV